MKLLIIISALSLVAGDCVLGQADEVSVDAIGQKSPQECVDAFRPEAANIEVPEDLKQYVGAVRELNKALGESSLIKIVDNPRCESDVYKTGIVNDSNSDELANSCAAYVSNLLATLKAPGCDQLDNIDESNYKVYSEIMSAIPELDETVGVAQMCFFI